MRWLTDLAFRLRALFTPGRLERDLDEEMEFHLDMATRKLVAEGMDPDEARRLALRNFGSPRRQKDRARWAWGVSVVRDLTSDTRLVGRQMRRGPGFAAGAVLTLALGIGANTAIFSVADQTLLREPVVRDVDELVAVYTTCRSGFEKCSSSWPDYIDYRDRAATLEGLAAFSYAPLNVGSESAARLATGVFVTGDYFSLLGVTPHSGRMLQPADNSAGAGATVAVLDHRFWTDAFGADPTLVGQTIRLNGAPFDVVGIAAAGFVGLNLSAPADIYIPLLSGPALGPGVGGASNPDNASLRGNRWIQTLVGRRAPGATHARVRAEMDALAAALAEQYPAERAAREGWRGITVDPIEGYILPLGSEDSLKGFVRMLLAVVGMTLLLAAANLANLLLARGTARSREIGIRMAVGAGRARVLRQLLTESVVLALVGGAVGLVVAALMLNALSAFELPGGVVIGDLGVGLDARTLGFTFGLALVTAVLFGLLPALQISRRDLVRAVKGEAARGRGLAPLRKGLVAVQLGLCVVLLIGSGLFLRTLRNSLDEDLGFEPNGMVAARFNLSLLGYDEPRAQNFTTDLLRRVDALPGVHSAAVSTLVPFQLGGFRGLFVEIDGYTPAPDEELRVDFVLASEGYFETLGTRIVEGRGLRATDIEGGARVAVINQHMAERYWPGRSALGGTFRLNENATVEVVGVVEDPSWQAVGEEASPFVFFAQQQSPQISEGFFTLIARTDSDEQALLGAFRGEFRALDPSLSLTSLSTMRDQVGVALMPQRMGSTLLTMLGALALILAAVGVYGVVNYTVTRRAREIGIRIAVGASGRRILGAVLREMLVPIGIGLAVGSAAAWVLTGAVDRFMFGLSAGDPLTFTSIVALLLFVAVGATWVPARRAARVDPVRVLKAD